MNRTILIVSFFVVSIAASFGQSSPKRNLVRLGLDYMTLDAPDGADLRPNVRLARSFGRDRFLLAATAGYLRASNRTFVADNVISNGRPRERFTTDLTLLFDFLKSRDYALRLGIGPAVWVRRDEPFVSASFTRDPITNQVTSLAVQRTRVTALDVGVQPTAEFEARITNTMSVGARFAFANFKQAGVSSIAGVGISFSF